MHALLYNHSGYTNTTNTPIFQWRTMFAVPSTTLHMFTEGYKCSWCYASEYAAQTWIKSLLRYSPTTLHLSLWMFSNDISVYSLAVKTERLLPDGSVVTLSCELFRGRLKFGPGQNVCSGWSSNANVMLNTMMNNNVSYVIILSRMFWTSPVPALFIPPVLLWVKNSNNLKLSLLMQVEQV